MAPILQVELVWLAEHQPKTDKLKTEGVKYNGKPRK